MDLEELVYVCESCLCGGSVTVGEMPLANALTYVPITERVDDWRGCDTALAWIYRLGHDTDYNCGYPETEIYRWSSDVNPHRWRRSGSFAFELEDKTITLVIDPEAHRLCCDSSPMWKLVAEEGRWRRRVVDGLCELAHTKYGLDLHRARLASAFEDKLREHGTKIGYIAHVTDWEEQKHETGRASS